MNMEIQELEAFVAVARTGSFTAAGDQLHVSQPAISRRIAVLEQELGAPLLERLPAGVRLSEHGRVFLPHVERTLAAADDARAAIAELDERATGELRLAVVGTLASGEVGDALRRFHGDHPAVDVRLTTARSNEVSALVRSGEATLGLRYFEDPRVEVISIPLRSERLLLVCSPDHRLAEAGRATPRELDAESWVCFPSTPGLAGEPYVRLLEQQLAANRITPASITEIDSLTAQKRLVTANFGVALFQETAIEEELAHGELVRLVSPKVEATIEVVAIHRRNSHLTRAAVTLLDLLRAA
jgi:DNA-binding transcriptional LysR family regulator